MRHTADIAARPRTAAQIRILFAVLVVLYAGCTPPPRGFVADVNAPMWLNPVTLTLANEDTLSLRNLHLFVRTDGRFTADSLPLQITFLTPDSVRYEERFTLVVSHKHSPSSLGSETGSVYRRRVRLVHRGDYRLIINPITPTEGIESIGIYLTKSE